MEKVDINQIFWYLELKNQRKRFQEDSSKGTIKIYKNLKIKYLKILLHLLV